MISSTPLIINCTPMQTSRKPISREMASMPPLPTRRIIAPELRRQAHRITPNSKKIFAAAAIVLLSLASSLSYAEQNTTPVRQNQRDTMIIPSEHNDSPFDFNHMAAGNDKSDELGVPYYQQHDL